MLRNYTQDMGSRCLLTISEIDLHVYWPFTVTNTFSEEFPTICSTLWRRQWQPTPVLLSGKSHGWRSLVGCSSQGLKESDTTERLPFHFSLSCIGEGNGNPLQCSCLVNPRDSRAWWAAVYGVAQIRTWLKRLNSSMLVVEIVRRQQISECG